MAASAMETKQPVITQAPIEQLPDELLLPILKQAVFADIRNAATIEAATQKVRNKAAVNKRFERLINDPRFVRQMIILITGKFPQETKRNPMIAAIFLNTKGAIQWLNVNVPNWIKQAKRIEDDILEKSNITSVKLTENQKKIFIALLQIPVIADYIVNEYKKNKPLGQTALGIATVNRYPELVKAILAAGANPNEVHETATPLLIAVGKGDKQIIKILLDAGADPNGKGDQLMGVTPLGRLAHFGNNTEIAQMLLDAGADINATQGYGWTALMDAAKGLGNKKPIVQWLLENGINTNAINNRGQTAAMIAREEGNEDLAKMIEDFDQNKKEKK